jgi:hypothetical protein
MADQQLCNERHDRIDARLKALEGSVKDFGEVVIAIKELAIETKYMREDMNDTMRRLKDLESKDTGKWDKFKWAVLVAIISATVGILVGAIAVSIGLK